MQRYLLWGIKTQLLFKVVSVISSRALEYIYQTSKRPFAVVQGGYEKLVV